MRSLVAGNGLDVVVDNRVKASSLEVTLGELLETLAVEGVLKVLQCQGILKDIGYFITVVVSKSSRYIRKQHEPSVTAARLATVAGAADTSPAATTAAMVA